MSLDVAKLRKDFPILQKELDGNPVIYMDNACMTLKPRQVIDAVKLYYTDYPACAGRSIHSLSNWVTMRMEEARETARAFLNAADDREIIFTKNTTESINIIAHSFHLSKGDKVLTTDKEHNSNLVPWHMLEKQQGIQHGTIPSGEDGTFSIENFKDVLTKDVKLISLGHTSNLDGTTIPAKEVIEIAHDNGTRVLLDSAQSAPHKKVDVKELDVDFLAFSVHKCIGPTGVGILYGKMDHLKKLVPHETGGETVVDTHLDRSELKGPPYMFEAGLQNYAGIVGTTPALKYLMDVGLGEIDDREIHLNGLVSRSLLERSEIQLIGPPDHAKRSGIFSFNIVDMEPHDVALMLNETRGIMLRSGMHCVHSWFNAHGIRGSVRPSFYFYNTEEEAKVLVDGVIEILDQFS